MTDASRPLRVVFMGTPDFAVPSLEALVADPRCDVVAVVSQPDRVAGRGKRLTPPPVKVAALAHDIPVLQPESLRDDEAIATLGALNADLYVVAAYGQILRQVVLDQPRYGCINVHASLLPRWRGAAPIHRAIEAGDAVTGVAIMQMERGLDTGPVYDMAAVMIGDLETAGELHDRLAALGAARLTATLDAIVDPDVNPVPQPHRATTYARMLGADDRPLSFDAPANAVVSRVNGMSPWPGAMTTFGELKLTLLRAQLSDAGEAGAVAGTVLRCDARSGLHVATADGGAVEVLELKRPGKRAMSARDCLCGFEIPVGARLGDA